jgi:hypothetical protein
MACELWEDKPTHQVGVKDMCRCQFVGFPSGTSELETASGILPPTRAASWQHDNDAVIVCITLAYHVNLLLQHRHLEKKQNYYRFWFIALLCYHTPPCKCNHASCDARMVVQHRHLLSCLLVFYLGLSVVAPFSKATSARTAGAFVVMEMWC